MTHFMNCQSIELLAENPRQCTQGTSNFQNFLREHTPRPPWQNGTFDLQPHITCEWTLFESWLKAVEGSSSKYYIPLFEGFLLVSLYTHPMFSSKEILIKSQVMRNFTSVRN